MKIHIADLETFCRTALFTTGVSDADAQTTTDVLVKTDTWGVFTHGTKALRNYIRRLQAGGLRANGVPHIAEQGPAWALVDGDSALGMVTSVFAMRAAIDKARAAGVGFAGVRNSCHYGAAGYYAAMALEHDMIGFSMANDVPTVTAPAARGPVLGSNPFAFAAPAEDEWPILLDMATSTVAGGKVFAAAALGKAISSDWAVDCDGKPTGNPRLFPHAAALTPLGGYKGFGLALMIEILAAVLTGASINWNVLSWAHSNPALATGHGAAFIAIDISKLIPIADFKARVDGLIREVHNAPLRENAERNLVPGELEWERRERALAEGIDLPEDVAASLRILAKELRLDIEGELH